MIRPPSRLEEAAQVGEGVRRAAASRDEGGRQQAEQSTVGGPASSRGFGRQGRTLSPWTGATIVGPRLVAMGWPASPKLLSSAQARSAKLLPGALCRGIAGPGEHLTSLDAFPRRHPPLTPASSSLPRRHRCWRCSSLIGACSDDRLTAAAATPPPPRPPPPPLLSRRTPAAPSSSSSMRCATRTATPLPSLTARRLALSARGDSPSGTCCAHRHLSMPAGTTQAAAAHRSRRRLRAPLHLPAAGNPELVV